MEMEGDLGANWQKFKDNFEIYLIATGCNRQAAVVQAAVLQHCMGQGAKDILDTLELTSNEKKDKNKILKELDEYFIPQKNTSIERHKFNTRVQMAGTNCSRARHSFFT